MPSATHADPSTRGLSKNEGAEVYDFRRPTTLAREHSRVLELAFETFARQWGTQLTAKVRTRSQVSFEQVHMKTYDEYVSALPATTSMTLLSVGDCSARGAIQFPASAALNWMDRMFGGNGGRKEDERKFSQIELGMLRRIVEDTVDDLKYSLGPLLAEQVTVDAVHHNSQFAQAAATTDLMIVAEFTIIVGDSSAPATLSLPAEVLMKQLGDANPVVSVEDARALVQEQIASVPLDVALRLPPVSITAAEVLRLSVGDVIPFNHPRNRPMELAVSGERVTSATPVQQGNRVALVVIKPLGEQQ